MISLASGLPLLQVGNSGISDYSSEWLETSIRNAAEEAGHDEWWFASDIVRSLFLYLKERFQSSVITVNQLFEKLRLTLTALGFNDIANNLRDQVPPCRISLMQIAHEASSSGFYELCFFQRLGARLDDASEMGTKTICASGLKMAVKQLCGSKRWSRSCDRLHWEILSFIQRRLGNRQDLTVQIV